VIGEADQLCSTVGGDWDHTIDSAGYSPDLVCFISARIGRGGIVALQ
jgi:hypothetical protein